MPTYTCNDSTCSVAFQIIYVVLVTVENIFRDYFSWPCTTMRITNVLIYGTCTYMYVYDCTLHIYMYIYR